MYALLGSPGPPAPAGRIRGAGGAMLGDESCPPRWLTSHPSSLRTRAAFPLISHSSRDGFSPCEPDVLHGA